MAGTVGTKGASVCVAIVVAMCSIALAQNVSQRPIKEDDLRSGSFFQQPETRALQDDDFANPGMLWLEKGREIYAAPAGQANIACRSCHGEGGEDVQDAAVSYPAYDGETGKVINIEQRINSCRRKHQQAAEFEWESEKLLALTVFLGRLSKGQPYKVSIDGKSKSAFELGRTYFQTRRGQLNLACTQCHDRHWGQMLRGDHLSQGHPTGFPAYRFTWERIGSLHRRFRDCDAGVRAEPLDYGSDAYVAVELYLAWRAGQLPLEVPAVRR